MMNPDQMYTVRQLRHDDLRAEAEQARVTRKLVGHRTAWSRGSFATWLRSLGSRQTRRTTSSASIDQAGQSAATRTA